MNLAGVVGHGAAWCPDPPAASEPSHLIDTVAASAVPRYLSRAEQPVPRGMSGGPPRRVIRTEFDPAAAYRAPAW